ncbi:unnamed protein product [Eruca vesicaria subsp. sativa]|uniref:Armadillo-like repeats domain-containing protein n=1 Tax=Eruca vesicaria subsp. sativa TaxID=29727 RepID=A0ABC8M9S0_ERUVS|nr:unnamed protein product [Eruca vesicaria subsp. sativa]
MASLLLPSSKLLLHSRTQHNVQPFHIPLSSPKTPFSISSASLRQHSTFVSASKTQSEAFTAAKTKTENKKQPVKKVLSEEEEVEEEVEEDMLWIQEKALDLVGFTGTVAQAIPGPRVGDTKLPWMLAVPLTYAVTTLVTAVVKTVNNVSSPDAQRKKLVNQNAMLCESIDALLEREGTMSRFELKAIEEKTEFNMVEILRKYIYYALNDKPFNPDLIENLIHLRRASGLIEAQIPEVLNEISRRIVKEKGKSKSKPIKNKSFFVVTIFSIFAGPVVMNKQGFTEKGFKRKLAVQTLFGKIFYLSEVPDFCLKDDSLVVKEIFGVTDEDAEKLRIQALAEAGDLDSLEKMVEFEKVADSSSSSDTEDSNEDDDSITSP